MAEDVKQKIEEIQNQKIPGEIQRVSGGLKIKSHKIQRQKDGNAGVFFQTKRRRHIPKRTCLPCLCCLALSLPL